MNPELWSQRPWLALLSILPVPLGAAWMVWAPRLPWAAKPRGGAAIAWITWLATRACFAILVWGVLGHRSLDATAFFLPQAEAASRGLIPYRDFTTAYAPLFPALLGLALRLGGAPSTLGLFLLADLGAWRLLEARERDPNRLSGAGWMYLTFPPVWYFAVRYAQDEPLSALCVAGALLAFERSHAVRLGLMIALGMLVTKPLFALVALPFLLAPGMPRVKLWLAASLPVLAVYGALWVLGAPVWQPLVLEGASFGIGPTLWRVPVVLGGCNPGIFGWVPFALVGLGGLVWIFHRRVEVIGASVWLFGAFALLSPKFMPMYVVMWAPVLAAWVVLPGRGGLRVRLGSARRAWWITYGALLPLAWYLDSGPLQGQFGPALQWTAAVGLLAIAGMAVFPLMEVARDSYLRGAAH